MTPEQLQEQIDELSIRLEASESFFNELKDEIGTMTSNQFQLTRTMAPEDKTEFRILIEEQIADAVWDDYFYISEFFQTTAAYIVGSTGTPPAVSEGAIQLGTGTSIDDAVFLAKGVKSEGVFSFGQEVRFRCNVKWGFENVGAPNNIGKENAVTYILTLCSFNGDPDGYIGTGTGSATGFKMEDGNLYGINIRDGVVSTILLQPDIEELSFYSLGIKYYPNSRVEFLVDKEIYGSLSDNLPKEEDSLYIGNFHIRTKDTEQKIVTVEYLEYMQKRIK